MEPKQLSLELDDHIQRAERLMQEAWNTGARHFIFMKNAVTGNHGLFSKYFDFYGSKNFDFLGDFTVTECEDILTHWPNHVSKGASLK